MRYCIIVFSKYCMASTIKQYLSFKNRRLVGQDKARQDVWNRRRDRCVLTVAPHPRQTTIITLSEKIKTEEKGNKQQFHHCSYEVCNLWEDTMNTPINTSPFFLLSLSNILEMELERLILYTALQAKGKLNENVNEAGCVWCVFSLNLLLCWEAFAIAIWNLVNLLFPFMNIFTQRGRKTERQAEGKKVGGGMVRLRL